MTICLGARHNLKLSLKLQARKLTELWFEVRKVLITNLCHKA